MCYVDDGSAQSLMDLGDLNTHLYTKFCIQVGERLIHKEYLRITNDGTTHGNTLPLTTGKSFRFTVKKFLKVKDSCSFTNLFVDLLLRNLAELQTKCHIIINSHMRIQSVVLEYHCDITVLRLYIIHNFVTDFKSTAGNFLKTCDHTKSCGFSASGWSYKDDKFFIFNFKIEILNSLKAVRIGFVNVL